MGADRMRIGVITAIPEERDAVVAGLDAPSPGRLAWYETRRAGDVLVLAGGVRSAAAAAAATAVVLEGASTLLNLGIAGAMPGLGLSPGDTVVASAAVQPRVGFGSPEEFVRSSPEVARFPCDPRLVETAHRRLPGATVGPLLTLSAATRSVERALELMNRHEAVAEAMEGAGVGYVAERAGIPFLEVRVISNDVGAAKADWDVDAGLGGLRDVAEALLADPDGLLPDLDG